MSDAMARIRAGVARAKQHIEAPVVTRATGIDGGATTDFVPQCPAPGHVFNPGATLVSDPPV
jgi:hypothetical protein